MGNLTWKILATASALAAGIVASKLADQVWKTAGQDKIDPNDPESPIWQAVAYAAITGLAVGAAKTFATRKAAQYYENSAGHLPAALQEH